MLAIKRPYTHLTTLLDIATGLDMQLDLELIRVRIAAVDDIEDATRIAALRHEHLRSVILCVILQINDGATDRIPRQRDHTVDEDQLTRRIACGAHEQVLIPAAPVPQVQEVVVDFWVCRVLQLD